MAFNKLSELAATGRDFTLHHEITGAWAIHLTDIMADNEYHVAPSASEAIGWALRVVKRADSDTLHCFYCGQFKQTSMILGICKLRGWQSATRGDDWCVDFQVSSRPTFSLAVRFLHPLKRLLASLAD